ncbi:phage portal protein [Polymorphobacter sp. PAMC 29334]|uniref:phage portal protein n=1 Tax=Polymorphobacter sp. PAMC 29334 TaxID=2862331 RepID=UPI001C757EBF|nr:phage portal protein [Polymorphobacter sp. PAMC 29334]QYE33687.1 phage portal protein [Polymorphobacter sp. PAMC 29334]
MNLNPFGRKSRSAQSRPAPARPPGIFPELSRASWGTNLGATRSYEALARDAYVRNPIAQRAVRIVAEGAAGAPVLSSPPGHPAIALLDGGEPGPHLIETVAANLLLHGNAYIEVGLGAKGLPVALYSLRPERVTVEPDASGWPVGYLYRAGTTLQRFPAVTVGAGSQEGRPGLLHIRSFHPLDDHYGLGCLGASAAAVETHNAASTWNKALLDNAARPSGALVYDPGDGATLSAEQFDRLKAEMEAGFAGAMNAGRPMLLDGGLKWQALSMTPAEMDFARTRDTASREIALAFGVPPMLLGLSGDNAFANYREANIALWRLTLLPLTSRILGSIATYLGDWWPGLGLTVDRDAIPALSADRERLWSQVSAANFLTDDEKRSLLGLEARP